MHKRNGGIENATAYVMTIGEKRFWVFVSAMFGLPTVCIAVGSLFVCKDRDAKADTRA